ncbi:hypothetical protein L3X38_042716 [Prunus dulcis]|uniref:Reverse transcriptase domain-containing protein n=1 Tax=Prunus dulcis TaxID=3755 RepID=A0AAD4YLJ6_PRUDU|nr:hypothetical protein L3X38_042716 [Prunus dulcis]
MEVYVDDMLVKSPERADHIKNLVEAFSLLQKYNMKLNPSKCTFRVLSDRFLGYLVTQRGIEQIDEDPSWQDPIIDYLVNGNQPTDKSEARKVQQKAAICYMQGDKLIRRSYF